MSCEEALGGGRLPLLLPVGEEQLDAAAEHAHGALFEEREAAAAVHWRYEGQFGSGGEVRRKLRARPELEGGAGGAAVREEEAEEAARARGGVGGRGGARDLCGRGNGAVVKSAE